MDINGREKAKRFWIVASLLGICMFVTANFFVFFITEKNEAEEKNGGDCKLCQSTVLNLYSL